MGEQGGDDDWPLGLGSSLDYLTNTLPTSPPLLTFPSPFSRLNLLPLMDSRLLIGPGLSTPDPTTTTTAAAAAAGTVETRATWNISSVSAHRLMELPPVATSVSIVPSHPFPTVDVPDHAHYVIGAVIMAVGITGMLGNFLVMYAFCRSRSLRTPANMFIINLAITDFLMCLTQTPIFFTTSMHKRWIFGKKGCELYAFCGALFGICSMITLMVIAVDRYVVITRPLASLGVMSRRKALSILAAAWLYSMGWSLPPFFGWSAYVPEGLLTSCSWDYMTFTPSVRSYTMLLFTFVFFIPLSIIIFCYCRIFTAIRRTTRAIAKITCEGNRDSVKRFHKMKSEWKMAKIALIVILLYVISWAPYSCVALTAFAGYADMLTPYMNSVPAVIAKASAIHNPIIYAITHPKYRSAISRYVPYLGALLCVTGRNRFSSSSFQSTRRSTLTSQSSESTRVTKPHLSSQSDSESAGFPDMEVERTPVSRQLSSDVKQVHRASQRSKVRGRDMEVFERAATQNPSDPSICRLSQISTLADPEGISMSHISLPPSSHLPATPECVMEEPGSKAACKETSSIIVTSISSPTLLESPPRFHGNQAANLKLTKNSSCVAKELLEIARLEAPLPCGAAQKRNDSV